MLLDSPREAFEMIAPIAQPQPEVCIVGANLFVLVMDTQGKPLAIAPLRQLEHNPFPIGQIRLIEGEARVLEVSETNALAEQAGPIPVFVRQVESALKRIYDLAFLGEHPLAQMQVVLERGEEESGPLTRLVRAKILRELLVEVIEQLRPGGPTPAKTSVPRRDWHPYLVLTCAYVEGEPNLQIMNWLQISEGTFNRTRRSALVVVAEVLEEMERKARE
jgi:hypothetical protein